MTVQRNGWDLDATGKEAPISLVRGFGLKGVAHNRNINAAATTHPGDNSTNTATWTAAENVREITILALNTTGAALQSDDTYLAVINAPDATTALAWLTDTGSASQDVQYVIGNVLVPLTIQRTSAITRLDVLPTDAAMRLVIEGVGV